MNRIGFQKGCIGVYGLFKGLRFFFGGDQGCRGL